MKINKTGCFAMNNKLLFSLPPKPPRHGKEERDETARKIVKRLARGNLSLQRGRCLTAEEIRERFDRL